MGKALRAKFVLWLCSRLHVVISKNTVQKLDLPIWFVIRCHETVRIKISHCLQFNQQKRSGRLFFLFTLNAANLSVICLMTRLVAQII